MTSFTHHADGTERGNHPEHQHTWTQERDGVLNGKPAFRAVCACGAFTPRHS